MGENLNQSESLDQSEPLPPLDSLESPEQSSPQEQTKPQKPLKQIRKLLEAHYPDKTPILSTKIKLGARGYKAIKTKKVYANGLTIKVIYGLVPESSEDESKVTVKLKVSRFRKKKETQYWTPVTSDLEQFAHMVATNLEAFINEF